MNTSKLKQMRRKQFVLMNVVVTASLAVYLFWIYRFKVTLEFSFLVVGIYTFVIAFLNVIEFKGVPLIPKVIREIKTYEKQKMGNEWFKQKRVAYFSQFFVSIMMFLQYMLHRGSNELFVYHISPTVFVITYFTIILITNISLYVHIRKVDRADTVAELKGHVWKTNIFGMILGIIFAMILVLTIMTLA